MTDPCPMAVEAERAWLALCNAYRPRTLYMTPAFKLRWARSTTAWDGDLVEIGTYTRDVRWDDFRADVFHVYDGMTMRRRA